MHPSKLIPAFRLRETLAATVAKPKRAGPLRAKNGRFKSAKRRRTKSKGA